MAKDLKSLIANIANLGKQASLETSVSDPAEKGTANTNVPTERIIAPLPGQGASTESTPAVSSSEPAGEAKVEHGESTGKVTPAQDYVEPTSVAGAKSAANLIEGAAILRNKLANFGQAAPAAAPAVPEVAPAAVPATPAAEAPVDGTKSASYVPGDTLLKVAFHLMESSAGQALINSALDEVLGHEKTAALMKQAADEHANFLREYTVSRLQQAELEQQQLKAAAEQQQRAQAFYELTKGASAEQLQAIDATSELIKGASAMFEDHPEAMFCAQLGFAAAEKVAAAMEQGMPPEEAAAMAGAEGTGGEGAPSPEELQSALMVLVEQGIISPEEAEQLMAEIAGGGAPGGEGGMPPGAEGGMPPEAAKQAAVQDALSKIASTIFA